MSHATFPMYVKDLLGDYRVAAEDEVVAEAIRVLERRVRTSVCLNAPQLVKDYQATKLAGLEYEVFVVLFLDSQHRLIECREMFRGTLTQTSVYPREVAREALMLNAGAAIVAHNHPSQCPEPSRADEHLTSTLKSALQLVDVRLLDHMVVGGSRVVSLAERGLV